MIGIIYLASGFSRRFGRNKLLYPIDGKAMYLHALEKLEEICQEKIHGQELALHVVSQYSEILHYCKEKGIAHTENTMAMEGIAASIRLGVGALQKADWLLFLPADQPGIQKDSIASFMECVLMQEKTMASVSCEDQPGNPTMFRACHIKELLALHGDKGGRSLMKNKPDDVFWYQISKEEIMDIDLLEDLENILK